MTTRTITELLTDLPLGRALCAFNVETFDTLVPALRAATDLSAPVVVAFSVPAARYFGYEHAVELVDLVARRFGTRYALHLDHCEDPDELRQAVKAGFRSANFLNEGALTDSGYRSSAARLREEYEPADVSLEFVLGTLGHLPGSDHDGAAGGAQDPHRPTPAAIQEFAVHTRPDILGFDCGSIHGMRQRSKEIDVALVGRVAELTGLPIVLHGSSGVRHEQVRSGIVAGIRKVNVETAIRTAYLDAVCEAVTGDTQAARKPRYLTAATDQALGAAYRGYLEMYTV